MKMSPKRILIFNGQSAATFQWPIKIHLKISVRKYRHRKITFEWKKRSNLRAKRRTKEGEIQTTRHDTHRPPFRLLFNTSMAASGGEIFWKCSTQCSTSVANLFKHFGAEIIVKLFKKKRDDPSSPPGGDLHFNWIAADVINLKRPFNLH